MSTIETGFYWTDATLPSGNPSYVERAADGELYAALQRGEFCYVLTSRQMGKSSLMVRTAARLREDGVAVAVLDLTALGQNLSAEQWYLSMLGLLGHALDLEDALEAYWEEHARQGPLRRWMQALREVVLPHCPGRIVLFVDEIDAVRSLPFSTDEFFAAIRECHNRRGEDPELARLTFCLLGVATPSDLIQDPRTTPFNIGRRIELFDFTAAEAAPLAAGLVGGDPPGFLAPARGIAESGERALPPGATAAMQRVLYWTGGHPYLTQRLCRALAEELANRPGNAVAHPGDVDRICDELFLAAGAREKDDNLLFVRDRLLRREEDRAGLLDLYRQVWRHRRVRADDTNPLVSLLQLAGIAGVVDGHLRVRNRIYERVFDATWVTEHMPDAELRRQRAAYRRGQRRGMAWAGAVLTVMSVLVGWALHNGRQAKANEKLANQNAQRADANARRADENARRADAKTAEARRNEMRANEQAELERKTAAEAEKQSGIAQTQTKVAQGLQQQAAAAAQKANQDLDNYSKRFVGFYQGFIKRWGFFEGVGPLTEEQVRHRSMSYKLTRYGRKNPVREMEVVNGYRLPAFNPTVAQYIAGVDPLQPAAKKECRYKVVWDAQDRRILNEQAFDGQSRLVFKFHYLRNDMAVFLDPTGYPRARAGSGAAYVKLIRSPAGIDVGARYKNSRGQPRPDREGRYGFQVEVDRRGLPMRMVNLDAAGRRALDKNGVAEIVNTYDARGLPLTQKYLGVNGRPTLNTEGVAGLRFETDRYGNPTVRAFVGLDGRPTIDKDGVARILSRYDARGNMVQADMLGLDGRLARSESKPSSRMAWSYDSRGRVVKYSFFGPDGRLLSIPGKYAWCTARYDRAGNWVETNLFDARGKPARLGGGYTRITSEYDERGNMRQIRYWGPDRRPARHELGYTGVRYRYGAGDQVTEETYLGADGKPGPNPGGIAQVKRSYDELGNLVEEAYFDAQGRRVVNQMGYARRTLGYNERGDQNDEVYFGVDNRPVRNRAGYCRVSSHHDEWGRPIRYSYFGPDGKPTLCSDGFAEWTVAYDRYGNAAEFSYLGLDGKPVLSRYDFAGMRYRYNTYRRPVERAFFGVNGELRMPANLGFARQVAKYDQRGNAVDVRFLDTEGKPTMTPAGYARVERRFDASGNAVEQSYYNSSGRLVWPRSGFPRVRYATNDRGEIVGVSFFDADGKPVRAQPQVVVVQVVPDGQGQHIGLQPGDVILSYNGTPVHVLPALRKLTDAPGTKKRSLEILRAGARLSFQVDPGRLGVQLDHQPVSGNSSSPVVIPRAGG